MDTNWADTDSSDELSSEEGTIAIERDIEMTSEISMSNEQ
jgi:hypothetical protein